MIAVAHRAGNSLAELRAALDAGVDLVEADVRLFRDALEVRHCRAIGRHLFWDGWDVNRRRSLAVPELADVLAAAGGDPRLMLDLKGPGLSVAPRVAGLLRRAAPGVPVTVCTKQWRMLDAFDDDQHVRRVFSASDPMQLARLMTRLRQAERPAYGVSIRLRLLTRQVVAELLRRGTLVMVWPVDTEAALARATRLGVSGVISKNLDVLRRVLAAR
ncbi:MAG: glycerophosphodiester phosphodiesterase [Micromonosporaceae bacterium]|nr:glycerophosphodiester phosphodiesterase [Micromonosporaceae bacterium]